MDNFKKNSFVILNNVISKDVTNFCTSYLSLKRRVARTLFDTKYFSPFTTHFGVWNDPQVPETYSHYSDTAMEILLQILKPIMEKVTKTNLIETYSYVRIYKKGDILHKHKDRESCEISTTLNLGGDLWPIYLKSKNKKEIEVNLNPGDMLIYKGCDLEHWRNPFTGNDCYQVFLHYNNLKGKFSEINKFDGRPHLGLPGEYKKGGYFNK